MKTNSAIAIRAAAWMAALRILKFLLPLPRVVQLLRRGRPSSRRDPALERRIVATVDRVAAYFQADGHGYCLERSLTVFRLLRRAGADPRIVVGMRRADGDVTGHVWVTLDGVAVGEAVPDDYVPIVAFDTLSP